MGGLLISAARLRGDLWKANGDSLSLMFLRDLHVASVEATHSATSVP